MPVNRMYSFKRNPYMQIARKILQTYNLRCEDIKKIKVDIKRISRGLEPKFIDSIADTIPNTSGTDELDSEAMVTALEEHMDRLIEWNRIVDAAYDDAVSNIKNPDLKTETRKALIRAYTDTPEQEFYMIAYPYDLPKSDYEERSRILLKYIIRAGGLMPYAKRIKFRPRNAHYKRKQRENDKAIE